MEVDMSHKVEKVFEIDPDLEIREELIGMHAINPFVANDSSARSHMASSHISQHITINNGDEKIMQTGLEIQFGDNTYSVKAQDDIRIKKIIYRYNGISANSVSARTEVFCLVENLSTGELDFLNLPHYFSLHQYFGFKYKWNKELLSTLMPGNIIRKDTIFADSPTVCENKGYKFGINANIALWSIPAVGEDGVVISKSTADRLSYTVFETRTVSFGAECFPLNIYGDENNYKAFPEIGDMINDDSVVMVLRDYDARLSPALTSKQDVRNFNPTFDRAVYVKGPGNELVINGHKVESGVVVDITAIASPRFKKNIYTDTANDVLKYVDGYRKYHQDIITSYEEISLDHFRRFKENIKVSERLHRFLIDSYAIVNPDNANIAYSLRNEPLDIFNITFTISYNVVPSIGSKISDLHGGKGVIVAVIPDEEMPCDMYGLGYIAS